MQQNAHSVMRNCGLATNPHLGLALGLREFDQTLLRGDIKRSDMLLAELEAACDLFSPAEFEYVESRRAALFLCQGIHFRLDGDTEQARICYEEGYRIQQRLNSPNGKGQSLAAFKELSGPAIEPSVLKSLSSEPTVIGDSESLLIGRLKTLPQRERINVILAAKTCQSWRTLQEGLLADNPHIVALAATALGQVDAGVDYAVLFQMLHMPSWIVRWQALAILSKRATQREEFASHRQEVHTNIQQLFTNGEPDPLVLCEMLHLLQQTGSANDTPLLLTVLGDSDQDVLQAAIGALESIGDTRAIPHLQALQSTSTIRDQAFADELQRAIQMIRARSHPGQPQNVGRNPSFNVKSRRTEQKKERPSFRVTQRRDTSE